MRYKPPAVNKIPLQLHKAASQLSSSPTPHLDAELLLSTLLKCRREALWSRKLEWSDATQERFDQWVQRRKNGEPIAYILGTKTFGDLTFEVNASVLIPRSETEQLVELAEAALPDSPTTLADIGCGCGNIAISLKHRHPQHFVIASDVSFVAIVVAQRNAKRCGTPLQWMQGDLLQPLIERRLAPSVLIANLPYLDPRLNHDPSILHEPRPALFAPTGIIQMQRLLQQLDDLPTLPRWIFFETDPRNANDRVQHPAYRHQIKKDLGGHDRFIILERLSES